MYATKLFVIDSIAVHDRIIYPIAKLNVLLFKNKFINMEYEVVAFKICENNKETYFKNVSLSKEEFDDLKISKKKK